MRQFYSTTLKKKVKGNSELLKIWFRSRHKRRLTLDLLMKNRALFQSMGENMVEERGYPRTDKKPVGAQFKCSG